MFQTITVIQAGGRSSRMGQDKALMLLGGKPMIAHVIERVSGLTEAVWITTNRPKNYTQFNLPMASDDVPGAGALPGLRTALGAVSAEFILLVACDMPFLSRPLMQHLLGMAQNVDVVMPRWENRLQPMVAVYRRDVCLAAVEKALANGQKRMISWLDDVKLHVVEPETVAQIDPDGLTFFNANTVAELATAETILKQSSEK